MRRVASAGAEGIGAGGIVEMAAADQFYAGLKGGAGAPSSAAEVAAAKYLQQYQVILDKVTPHTGYRWAGWLALALLYFLRVYMVQGFFIVTYALGIFNLNLLIGFISPQVDPELEGPSLPTREGEFKPFVRRLPEFKFWYTSSKSFVIAMACTLFRFLDVPVFWPILLFYWLVLFSVTMKKQIKRMIKYRYLPFSTGKKVSAAPPGPPPAREAAPPDPADPRAARPARAELRQGRESPAQVQQVTSAARRCAGARGACRPYSRSRGAPGGGAGPRGKTAGRAGERGGG